MKNKVGLVLLCTLLALSVLYVGYYIELWLGSAIPLSYIIVIAVLVLGLLLYDIYRIRK